MTREVRLHALILEALTLAREATNVVRLGLPRHAAELDQKRQQIAQRASGCSSAGLAFIDQPPIATPNTSVPNVEDSGVNALGGDARPQEQAHDSKR